HTRSKRDWSSDVCSSDLAKKRRRPYPVSGCGDVSAFTIAHSGGLFCRLKPSIQRWAAFPRAFFDFTGFTGGVAGGRDGHSVTLRIGRASCRGGCGETLRG